MYTCLSMCPNTSYPRSILRPSVSWSKPSRWPFTAAGPSRTDSSIDLLHWRRLSHAQYLHIIRQETCCACTTHAMVSLNTQNQRFDHLLTITRHSTWARICRVFTGESILVWGTLEYVLQCETALYVLGIRYCLGCQYLDSWSPPFKKYLEALSIHFVACWCQVANIPYAIPFCTRIILSVGVSRLR